MKLIIKKSLSTTTPLTCLGYSANKETRKFEITTPARIIESNHNKYGLNRIMLKNNSGGKKSSQKCKFNFNVF